MLKTGEINMIVSNQLKRLRERAGGGVKLSVKMGIGLSMIQNLINGDDLDKKHWEIRDKVKKYIKANE